MCEMTVNDIIHSHVKSVPEKKGWVEEFGDCMIGFISGTLNNLYIVLSI